MSTHDYHAPVVSHADFRTLGITGTPTALLVDEHGVVLAEWNGLLSSSEEADLAAHLGVDPHMVSHTVGELHEMLPNDVSGEVLTGELSAIIARHQAATVLDVRERKDFDEDHLSGAVNIPADELQMRAAHELSRKVPLLLYCSFSPQCAGSGVGTLCTRAEYVLNRQGFTGVRYIRDRLPLLAQEGFGISHGASVQVASR